MYFTYLNLPKFNKIRKLGFRMVNFFGALKGIGSFTEKDKFKGQFEE